MARANGTLPEYAGANWLCLRPVDTAQCKTCRCQDVVRLNRLLESCSGYAPPRTSVICSSVMDILLVRRHVFKRDQISSVLFQNCPVSDQPGEPGGEFGKVDFGF